MSETFESEARPSKEVTIGFASLLAPEYVAVLRFLQRNGGRYRFPEEIIALLNWTGPLVPLYEDEQKLNGVLALGVMGEEGLKEWANEVEALKPGEDSQFLDKLIRNQDFEEIAAAIPETDKEWEAAREAANLLSEAERAALGKQAYPLFGAFFGSFFNILSLMVHGAKLTTLVPHAIAGEEDAFLKALQVDRRLLVHHPYFRDVKQRAQDEGNRDLLSKIAYRESNPPLRGKIRYPGLYMVFAILQSLRWLDDLTHVEMLDVCDRAGLDRYQNRIDDVNCLTKRLREYRRWQKSGGVSMH